MAGGTEIHDVVLGVAPSLLSTVVSLLKFAEPAGLIFWMDVWEGREPTEPVGAVFTKPEVTSLILDLAGYTPENGRLTERRLLEPSCGDGAFLAAIIQRLIASERLHSPQVDWDNAALARALTACDLNSGFVALARQQ